MRFQVAHDLEVPLDAVELAVVSPELIGRLAPRLPNMESVRLVSHRLDGSVLERVVSYQANVRLPAFARDRVPPTMRGWDERVVYDLKKHRSEWTITPRIKPEWQRYFRAWGTYALVAVDEAHTRRIIEGDVELSIPLVGPVFERLIVAEVRKTFDAEVETLRDLATLV